MKINYDTHSVYEPRILIILPGSHLLSQEAEVK